MDFFVLQSSLVPYPAQKIPISLHPLYFSIPHSLTFKSHICSSQIGFDIVISDVHMPDMDGFKLLEQIGLKMDLHVIMIYADDGKAVVMKGVTHGACDYLIKLVHIEALKNIWQYMVRKKKNEKEEDDDNEERDDSSTLKKPRVVWSGELPQHFFTAINQLGIDKAVSKKLLELMNVPGLTRENKISQTINFPSIASRIDRMYKLIKKLPKFPRREMNSKTFLELWDFFPNEKLFLKITIVSYL
ncbi:hypothetical protein UlMin_041481 [Ulmus minor]